MVEKHTPGPWAYENCGEKANCLIVGKIWLVGGDHNDKVIEPSLSGHFVEPSDKGEFYREIICEMEDCSEAYANAKLIAQAPGMADRIKQLEGEKEVLMGLAESLVLLFTDEEWDERVRVARALLKDKKP